MFIILNVLRSKLEPLPREYFYVLIAFIMGVVVPFNETREFIKMEMNRASGRKYRYWKKELRNLYLSHIPIVRWFVRKRH